MPYNPDDPEDNRPNNSIFPTPHDDKMQEHEDYKEGDETVKSAFNKELDRFLEEKDKLCEECHSIELKVIGLDKSGRKWVFNNSGFYKAKKK